MNNFLRKLLIEEKHLWYFQYNKLFEQKEFIDFIQEYNQHFGIETTDYVQKKKEEKLNSRITRLEHEIKNCNEIIGSRDFKIKELESEIENLKKGSNQN
jgi:predicted RNase H-like nuclease (RuvC/YqgF family)